MPKDSVGKIDTRASYQQMLLNLAKRASDLYLRYQMLDETLLNHVATELDFLEKAQRLEREGLMARLLKQVDFIPPNKSLEEYAQTELGQSTRDFQIKKTINLLKMSARDLTELMDRSEKKLNQLVASSPTFATKKSQDLITRLSDIKLSKPNPALEAMHKENPALQDAYKNLQIKGEHAKKALQEVDKLGDEKSKFAVLNMANDAYMEAKRKYDEEISLHLNAKNQYERAKHSFDQSIVSLTQTIQANSVSSDDFREERDRIAKFENRDFMALNPGITEYSDRIGLATSNILREIQQLELMSQRIEQKLHKRLNQTKQDILQSAEDTVNKLSQLELILQENQFSQGFERTKLDEILLTNSSLIKATQGAKDLKQLNGFKERFAKLGHDLATQEKALNEHIRKNAVKLAKDEFNSVNDKKQTLKEKFIPYPTLTESLKDVILPSVVSSKITTTEAIEILGEVREANQQLDELFNLYQQNQALLNQANAIAKQTDPGVIHEQLNIYNDPNTVVIVLELAADRASQEEILSVLGDAKFSEMDSSTLEGVNSYTNDKTLPETLKHKLQFQALFGKHEEFKDYVDDKAKLSSALLLNTKKFDEAEIFKELKEPTHLEFIHKLYDLEKSQGIKLSKEQLSAILNSDIKLNAAREIINKFTKGDEPHSEVAAVILSEIADKEENDFAQMILNIKDNESLFNPFFLLAAKADPDFERNGIRRPANDLRDLLTSEHSAAYQVIITPMLLTFVPDEHRNMKKADDSKLPTATAQIIGEGFLMAAHKDKGSWLNHLKDYPKDELPNLAKAMNAMNSAFNNEAKKHSNNQIVKLNLHNTKGQVFYTLVSNKDSVKAGLEQSEKVIRKNLNSKMATRILKDVVMTLSVVGLAWGLWRVAKGKSFYHSQEKDPVHSAAKGLRSELKKLRREEPPESNSSTKPPRGS